MNSVLFSVQWKINGQQNITNIHKRVPKQQYAVHFILLTHVTPYDTEQCKIFNQEIM